MNDGRMRAENWLSIRAFSHYQCAMNTTGARLSKGDEVSPAWQKASEVIAMYKAGIGFTIIARKLEISKRITREILIKRGHWKPAEKMQGRLRKGRGKYSLLDTPQRLADAMRRVDATCKSRLNGLHAAMLRVVARCQRPVSPMAGMSDAQRYRHQYRNDPAFRMKELIRRRMRKIIMGEGTSTRQLALLGCTRAEFMAHIERQFAKGMTWENNGTGQGKWHLDHITPCSVFDQAVEHQRRACWHFTNLRPMWSIENIRKSNTVDYRNAQLSLGV